MTFCEVFENLLKSVVGYFTDPACQATSLDWEEAILSLQTAVQRTHEYLSGFENRREIPTNPDLALLWQEASYRVRKINESLSNLLDSKIEFYLCAEKYFQESKDQFIFKLEDASESLNQLKRKLNRRYDYAYFQNFR